MFKYDKDGNCEISVGDHYGPLAQYAQHYYDDADESQEIVYVCHGGEWISKRKKEVIRYCHWPI